MLDRPHRYPLLRGRGRGHRRRRLPRIDWRAPWLRIALIGIVSVALVGGVIHFARRAMRPDARAELAIALGHLKVGNYSAARNDARRAIERNPDWGLAHAVLARAYLALGEGLAAEGALDRAVAAGFVPARARHLRAEAFLLEGDSARARSEAAQAEPRYAGYAARIDARALAAQGDYPAASRALAALVARAPDDSLAWSALGRVRLAASDIAGASDAAARAVAADPANLDGLVLAGELARSRYGLDAALPWFAAARLRDRFYAPAVLEEAATLGDLGRYTEMLGAARDALAAQPGNPRALYYQAVLAARAGQLGLARAILAKLGDSGMPGVLLLGGGLDYAAGAYERAIGKWRELVARQPMNLPARRLLGAALLKSGDAKGALATLRPIALRDDADAYTLTLTARAFEAIGERGWAARQLDRAANPGGRDAPFGMDDSIPVLASAVNEAPDDPGAAVGFIRGLIEAGRGGEALARARQIAAAAPGTPQAQLLVGDVLASRGGSATAAYARAADLRFDAATMLRLVDALARDGDSEGAAEALGLYLAQNPASIVARRAAAQLQLQGRDWRAAIATLEDLRLATGDRDAALLAGLAHAYAGAGDARAALHYGRAAYRLVPMSAAASDAYGWARYQAGDARGAAQLLAKAASIAPRDTTIRWHLAQALADSGDAAGARAALDIVLADPRFADRAPAMALRTALR